MNPTSLALTLARGSKKIPVGMKCPSTKWWVWSEVNGSTPYTTHSTALTQVLVNLLVRSEWPGGRGREGGGGRGEGNP